MTDSSGPPSAAPFFPAPFFPAPSRRGAAPAPADPSAAVATAAGAAVTTAAAPLATPPATIAPAADEAPPTLRAIGGEPATAAERRPAAPTSIAAAPAWPTDRAAATPIGAPARATRPELPERAPTLGPAATTLREGARVAPAPTPSPRGDDALAKQIVRDAFEHPGFMWRAPFRALLAVYPHWFGAASLALGVVLLAIGLADHHVTNGPCALFTGVGWIACKRVPLTHLRLRFAAIAAVLFVGIFVEMGIGTLLGTR